MYVSKKAKAAESTAFLEGYLTCAKEMEIPLRAVCERLGEILSAQGQRNSKYLSELRKDSAGNTPKRKAVEQVEDASNTHRRAPHSERLTKTGRRITPKALRAMRAAAANARAAKAKKAKARKAELRAKAVVQKEEAAA